MLQISRWKVSSILLMTFLAFLLLVPSLLPADLRAQIRDKLPSFIPFHSVVLGLDLQGGAHLLYEVDTADVLKTQLNNLKDDIRRVGREEKVRLDGGVTMVGRSVRTRVPDAQERAKIVQRIRPMIASAGMTALGNVAPARGELTSNDDGMIQITLTEDGIKAAQRRAVEQTIEVLNRRVNGLGTTEPNIQRVGDDRVLVEVPGLQNTDRLKEIVGTTAKLEFRMVSENPSATTDVEMLPDTESGQTIPVEKQVLVQGEDLTDAHPNFDQQTGQPVVNFAFNSRGGQKFAQITTENVGKLFAIVLDNKVISAPRIQTPITGGSGQISGRFTVEQANNLAILLRAGALPARLTIAEERTVGPGLGQDSIDAGKLAAYVGGFLVIAYMLMTYGIFGVFADIALAIHILLIFAALILLKATLTLPGIAGIVFTIGMAVDSNVLIYERIREEVHEGRSIISALDIGFQRAFATIVDSNATMMVAAVILYFLGSGPVRGFAVSLGLGILTTIVTAVTMTRMMISLWYKWARPKELPI